MQTVSGMGMSWGEVSLQSRPFQRRAAAEDCPLAALIAPAQKCLSVLKVDDLGAAS